MTLRQQIGLGCVASWENVITLTVQNKGRLILLLTALSMLTTKETYLSETYKDTKLSYDLPNYVERIVTCSLAGLWNQVDKIEKSFCSNHLLDQFLFTGKISSQLLSK